MLAYVEEKARKGSYFLEVKLDKSRSHFLRELEQGQTLVNGMQAMKNGYLKMHVYILESLSTTIREYKTLRMSEFYGLSETILDPKKSLQNHDDKKHKHWGEMQKYLKTTWKQFNPSQQKAL